MSALIELIKREETALVSRVCGYAEKTGYMKYTPINGEVWAASVKGLSNGLISALTRSTDIPELSPEIDFTTDDLTLFGIEQARKHRFRGVTLELFLGLMKYFRQSYHDIVDNHQFKFAEAKWAHTFIERYFDKIELGFIAEWERSADELKVAQEKLLIDGNAELSALNSTLELKISERKRAELQINRLNRDLEKRVETRTLELQRKNEQSSYRLKELLILNRLSSLNLAKIRLNRLTRIILSALTSNAPLFFDRALLFLLNERTQTLQGMLAAERPVDPDHAADELHERLLGRDDDVAEEPDTPLSRELRAFRIELKKGRGAFSRAVNEKRIIAIKSNQPKEHEGKELFSRLGIAAAAIMPLSGKDGIFGVVIVDNPVSLKTISKNDLRFLQLFSNQAGIAIENLMLYTSLEDANRKLQETQEQLVHGERLATIGEMAASIAHELKGPMVAIGGFARRLGKKMAPESVEAGYVATIIEEEQRLEGMLDEVLSFSRKTTICYDRCSITEVVESALSILTHVFEKNCVLLTKSFPKKDVLLYADCQQLKQVFINLFHNALDAMREGGELRLAVTHSRLGGERAVSVRIADTGGGVPDSLCNSIFNPFFTTKSSGTGLGLPIASRIISNHKGKIRVRNHQAGGAEFTVILPCQE